MGTSELNQARRNAADRDRATKPWLDEYQHKLAAATILGPSAEETLKYPLPTRFGQGLAVIYETENRCRVVA